MKLALDKIRFDGGTQPRAVMDAGVVSDYAERMAAGDKFPEPVVFDDGKDLWLADGFHRAYAAEENGWTEIECNVRKGTLRDAILYSVGANATHGKPRTNADKKQAVMTLLRDDEWVSKSDRWIAEKTGVHHNTVEKYRIDATGELRQSRQGKDGRTIDTTNIGKKPKVVPTSEAKLKEWLDASREERKSNGASADHHEHLLQPVLRSDGRRYEPLSNDKVAAESFIARAKQLKDKRRDCYVRWVLNEIGWTN